jgi:serine/threonine protein kinase
MSSKIGRFEVLSELSRSANGAVYKANDPGAGRNVVLKTLKVDLPPDLARILIQIILREADSSKVLNSQNIALLYGAGEIDGQFCAAMEYVEGNSLAAMIARQEGFSIWDLLDISRQVCNALDHADTRGVLHRGLEPEKIMMQWDGTVKVLGYGVSTMVSAIPKKGAVPPLFYYMSPEQVKGEQMDIRSNLFTWGAILYEMVTDRKPFTGPDIQTVRQKLIEETPEPPATINPRINLGVSRVIMQALSKSPEERYQHGHELMLDLDRAKEPVAKPTGTTAPPTGIVTPQKLSPTPAQKAAPASAGVSVLNSAGSEVIAAPKRAAAAAGVGGAGKTSTAAPASSAIPQPAMSAAVAPPPPTEKPKFSIDPMMAEDGPAARKAASSFSDLEEMPPLKEVFVAPEPPPPAEEEPVVQQPLQTFALRPRTIKAVKPERPRVITRENAKKAISEIRTVPPQLLGYAAAAAAAFILIVVMGIWLYIRHQNADSAPPPEVQATANQETAPVQPSAVPVTPPVAAEPEPEVTVTPQFRHEQRKRPKPRAPEKPISILGEITVNSVPDGAQVQVDGRTDPSWLTPYTVTGLKPGQHSISLAKSGFNSESRSVDLGLGGKSQVVVHLTQLGVTLMVSSQPAGASVFIDGKNAGHTTPAHIAVSERGTHTILVRKDGYLDETTTVSLTPGQTFNYSPVLRAMGVTEDIKVAGKFGKLFGKKGSADMGRISAKTQPKGAQITANHRMVDKLTPVDFWLNPGSYMIDITMPGYKPLHRVINVEEGSKIELNENLEPE